MTALRNVKFVSLLLFPITKIGRRTRTGAIIDHNPLYNIPGSFVQEPQTKFNVTQYRIAVAVLSTAFLLALTVIALLSIKQTQAQSIGIQQRFLGKC